jgi:HEPN domain-containing protein
MKGKADLVQGLLRKAASDLLAIRATAAAGSLDAACFHAQQAAEKYLKAYLAEHDREIPHTHNLYKLLALCTETNPVFDQLTEAAGLLTPFAVEARYDTEFWPSLDLTLNAEVAANRIREMVRSLVKSAVDPVLLRHWQKARNDFSWRVDLKTFKDASRYQPEFFNRVVEPWQTTEFEDAFRAELVPGGRVERAAEVVYWKNFGNFGHTQARRFLRTVNTP